MTRGDLTNEEWARLEPLLPSNEGKVGHPFEDHRRVINGILWVARTGAPWRDLPERYGPHGTCHDRLTRWQRSGLWTRVLQALQGRTEPGQEVVWEFAAVDSTTVRAHQHAAGAAQKPVAAEKGGRLAC
jgi:transposase